MKCRVLKLSSAVFLSALTIVPAISGQTTPAPSGDLEQVRHFYYNTDQYRAAATAEQLVKEKPDDVLARGWLAAVGSRSQVQKALPELKKIDAESAWSMLARAALATGWERREFCDKAIAKAPKDVDILSLATYRMEQTLHLAENPAQSKAFEAELTQFFKDHQTAFEESSKGLAALAEAKERLGLYTRDRAVEEEAIALATKALAADKTNVQALEVKSTLLVSLQRKDEAFELLKSAVPLVPDAYDIQRSYVKLLMQQAEDKQGGTVQEIIAVAERYLAQPSARVLNLGDLLETVHSASAPMADSVCEALSKKHPNTAIAEVVELYKATEERPSAIAEKNDTPKIEALEAILSKPKHVQEDVPKEARKSLIYYLGTQSKPDVDRIYQEIQISSDDASHAVVVLADNKVHLSEIELIAQKQLDHQWKLLSDRMVDQTDKQGFTEFSEVSFVAPWLNSLGWVYYQSGKLDLAEEKLRAAVELYPKSIEYNLHLARALEARGNKQEAETLYQSAVALPSYEEGEHPGISALREFYLRTHGEHSEGLDAYMKPIVEKDRERRKKEILAAKARQPKSMPAFSLTDLDGKPVSSESLKGKILVINFWATWCGPCRKELPDFQKLYEKYKDDPQVAVLSVATDDVSTPKSTITSFVSTHKYGFPVLLGADYADQNSVRPIPMTWFVDTKGNRSFEKMGFSKELLEEFSWRIEALRN